ncbi:MAB_1171c family putative transporter [Streptomyces avermitilis]|uniref:MAB_1171c family putative transporter n=1 Tax=Streptomyces avermitilis TaxID=33903 RepID=UPI0033E93870
MTTPLTYVFSCTHILTGLICLATFRYKWRDFRRDPKNFALGALCATRFFNGLAYLILAPVTYVWIGELSGIPNLGTLLSHSFIVLAALAAHVMVTGWFRSPKEASRRLPNVTLLYLLAFLAMSVLFFATPLPGAHPVDFEVHFATQPTASAYVVVFVLTYGLNLANTARHTWPSSRAVGLPWLSQSLLLTTVGSFFVEGFILGKLLGVVGRWCGVTWWDQTSILWSPLMGIAGSLLLAAGYTLPGWGAALSARFGQWRSCCALHPLWSALCGAAPDIALHKPRSPYLALCRRDLQSWLYRIVIEIRDGQRLLRPYVCDACEERLRLALRKSGLTRDDNADLFLEAALLALAVQRKKAGFQPSGHPTGSGSLHSGSEFADELAWLRQVAQAYVRVSTDPRLLPSLHCECRMAPSH